MNSSQRMSYTIPVIAEITGSTWEGPDTHTVIKNLLTDSRRSAFPENTLFFALSGNRNNGHKYIGDLYLRGFRFFVVGHDCELPEDVVDATFIRTGNVLAALQKLASYHRQRFTMPVTGITGSNGKTVVKEWLSQLLSQDNRIVKSPKSFNSQTGVPLSVWQMESRHNLAIFEAGISQPGEMQKLQEIIRPTLGIFTNIGEAHAENFSSSEEKIREKLKLFQKSDQLIYSRDYLLLDEIIRAEGIRTFTWSRSTRADLQVTKVNRTVDGTEIKGVYQNRFTGIKIPFTDEASVENAIHCWAFMLLRAYPENTIQERMMGLSPVEMRLEMKEGINNCSVINDSYNSDPGSLSIALDFLNQQKQFDRRTLILSDILQTGRNEKELYQQVAEIARSRGVTRIIGIGESISRQSAAFVMERSFYPDTDTFLNEFSPEKFVNEAILLKGARVFGFERINRVLQQKAHETVLEVNLTALIHNLNYFRSKIDPSVRIMAMVKAFSYGSGSFEIASVLQFHRVDYLAVAYTDEGVELRRAGITLPILVMNPEEQSYDVMIHYRLEPELFSMRVLRLFIKAIGRHRNQANPFPVHLKLDTGMHRLGFVKEDLPEALLRIKNCSGIKVRSVFSHLAASDEPALDSFTQDQISKFNSLADEITDYLGYPVYKHILNSAGISRFPEAAFDMVRLGIGMYGVGANATEQEQLRNVSTLKTTISQIKKIPAGETIGYNRKGVATKETVVATIPIGYADGLNRRLSNGKGKVFINGKPAPVIGNICMDMTMVDITGIQAQEGQEVIVFGDEHPVSEIAKSLETISYEVFTSISRRVKRIFFQE